MSQVKKTLIEASNELFALLQGFTPEERMRIVSGTFGLLGEPVPPQPHAGPIGSALSSTPIVPAPSTPGDARQFFAAKATQGVSELLAAAARFHELTNNLAPTTKSDFDNVIRVLGRRNFDATNFARDIFNAQTAGYFNKGGDAKTGYQLSHVGQDFIDALPDRERAGIVRANRPKAKSRKPKSKAAKKTAAPGKAAT
jgi:hypothetical protein